MVWQEINSFQEKDLSFFNVFFFTLQRSEWTPLEMKSVPGAREGSEEEGMELGETVCPCGKVYEETGVFMIQCDICRDWMHGECVRWGSEPAVNMWPGIKWCFQTWRAAGGRCGQVSLPQVHSSVWAEHHEGRDKLAQVNLKNARTLWFECDF